MKKILSILVLGMFLISLASASDLGRFEINSCVELYQSCESCTFVNLTSVKIPGVQASDPMEIQIIGENMTNFGYDFTYQYCNTSRVGGYKYNVCGDKGGSITCENIDFRIGNELNELTTSDSLVRIFLVIFFITLLFIIHHKITKVDFKKWNDSIIKKYHNKNFVKMVLAALAYNLTKNSYVIYYLIGLPIVMIITNLIYVYNITGLIAFMNAFLFIYTIGILIVGIIFLSYVQEWSMDMIELVRDMDWGIER